MTYPSNLPDISEHALQVQVLDVINVGKSHPDIFAFAIPNAARRSWKTGQRMKSEGLMKGAADLCIVMPEGKSGWLEMKTLKGKQSDEQKGFAARCKRLGHRYAVAHTFEEAVDALKDWGTLR